MIGQDIDDDLTKDGRSIYVALRQRARTEREKGNDEVRVGYQKILLNGQWVPWGNLDIKKRGTSSSPIKTTTKGNPNELIIATLNTRSIKTDETELELQYALP